jgi:hypothetical protein
MDVITVDPAAEDNGLAAMLQGLLGENIAASSDKRRDFEAIGTSFAVIAPDAEVSITLVFDHGRCTIHQGVRPSAEVIITTDSEKIPSLSLLQIRHGVPWVLDDAGKQLVQSLVRREIRIEGLVDLPIPSVRATARRALDLVRLTRVLSVNG